MRLSLVYSHLSVLWSFVLLPPFQSYSPTHCMLSVLPLSFFLCLKMVFFLIVPLAHRAGTSLKPDDSGFPPEEHSARICYRLIYAVLAALICVLACAHILCH